MNKIYLFIWDSILSELIQETLAAEALNFTVVSTENAFRLAQLTEFDLLIIDSEMVLGTNDQIIFLLKNSASKRILIKNKEFEENLLVRFDRKIDVNEVPLQLISSISLISNISEVIKPNIEYENLLKIQSQLFHEINNRLSSIFINSKLLLQTKELQDGSITEHVQHILNSAKDIQENLNNFNNFINCKKFFTAREDLNQLISETLKEKQELIKSKFFEVNTKYDFNVDFLELNRIIVSKLLLSAIEFIGLMSKENPILNIETANERDIVRLTIISPNCMNDKSLFDQIFNPLFPRKMMDEKVLKELNKNIRQLMKMNVENHFSNDTNSVIFVFNK